MLALRAVSSCCQGSLLIVSVMIGRCDRWQANAFREELENTPKSYGVLILFSISSMLSVQCRAFFFFNSGG